MINIIKVTGNSLSPFFLPGDFVITFMGKKTLSNLQPGDMVIFDHPEYGTLIKIVKDHLTNSSSLVVEGSNPDSTSSHKLGPIPYNAVRGKVIYSVKQHRS